MVEIKNINKKDKKNPKYTCIKKKKLYIFAHLFGDKIEGLVLWGGGV